MNNSTWEAMNDLEMVVAKVCSAREIIDVAIDRIQEHQYDKAESMMSAAYEFLGYYLDEFDKKFKVAWQETIVKQKDDCMPPWGHSDMEALKYSDEELDAMCDNAEKQHSGYYYEYDRNDPNRENPFGGKYTITIDQEGNLPLPDELLNKMGITIGDYLQWEVLDDNKIKLKKVDNVSVVEKIS